MSAGASPEAYYTPVQLSTTASVAPEVSPPVHEGAAAGSIGQAMRAGEATSAITPAGAAGEARSPLNSVLGVGRAVYDVVATRVGELVTDRSVGTDCQSVSLTG